MTCRSFIGVVVASLLWPSSALAQCESLYDEDLNDRIWVRYEEVRYAICYDSRYEQDSELTRTWVDNAFQIAEDKYSVVPPVDRRGHELTITIYLVPVPTAMANSYTATVVCCSDSESLEIHIMSPSAPEYSQDSDHFIKTLTHEMMNTLHYESRESPNITPPLWIREGLAEYEGYCSTTPANEAKLNWLAKYVYEGKLEDIYYGTNLADRTPTIVSADRYYGSAVIMYFLAVQFGEGIHYELFKRSLNAVLWEHRVTAQWVFEGLSYWMNEVGRSEDTSWACPGESLDASSNIDSRKEVRKMGEPVDIITHTDHGTPPDVDVIVHTDHGQPDDDDNDDSGGHTDTGGPGDHG